MLQTKESDDRYNERLVELKKRSITPNDLNVDRKYWLNDVSWPYRSRSRLVINARAQESFEKPKEEEKNRSRSNSIHADRVRLVIHPFGYIY